MRKSVSTRSAPSGLPDISAMLAATERGDVLDLKEYRRRNPPGKHASGYWFRPLERDELLAWIYLCTGHSHRPPAGLYGAMYVSVWSDGTCDRRLVTTSRRHWLVLRRDEYCGNYRPELKEHRQQLYLGKLHVPQVIGGAQ